MTIRKALEKDIPQMLELLLQVNRIHHEGRPDLFNLGRKYTEEELKELLKAENYVILAAADENDVMQGYMFGIIKQLLNDNIRTAVKTFYIDDLCVDENCRGRHLGKQLLEAAKQVARDLGCYNLTLNVWSLNESARLFYEKCGLSVQKQEMEVIL